MCVMTAMLLMGGTAMAGGATIGIAGSMLAGVTLSSAVMSDIGLVGAGMSAMSSMNSGDAEADSYEYQAAVEANNASLREFDQKRKRDNFISTQVAQFGAMNLDPNFGSAPSVFGDTAYNAQFDIFNDNFSSQMDIGAYGASADNARREGKQKAVGTLINYGMKLGSTYA